MLPRKIKTTSKIRSILALKRQEKGLSGADLSSALNLTSSYISSIENNHIKSISQDNFIRIIRILYDVDEEKAISIIEDLISLRNQDSGISDSSLDISDDDLKVDTEKPHIYKYNQLKKEDRDQIIDVFSKSIAKLLKRIDDDDEKAATSIMYAFTKSIEFDLGFMIVTWLIPYFKLKKLNHDERQQFLNQLSDLFKKYELLAKSKDSLNDEISKEVSSDSKQSSCNESQSESQSPSDQS